MMIPDRKKAVTVILSKLSPGGDPKTQDVKDESEMDDDDSALKAISEDIMQAFHSKSAHDFMVALKAFIDEYDNQNDEDSSDEGSEPKDVA